MGISGQPHRFTMTGQYLRLLAIGVATTGFAVYSYVASSLHGTEASGLGIDMTVLGVGLVLMAIPMVLLTRISARSKQIEQLKATGQRIQGVVTDVSRSMTSNQRNVIGPGQDVNIPGQGAVVPGQVYKVVASANDPGGGVREFTSDKSIHLPRLLWSDYHNDPVLVDIYISRSDADSYYVDVSSIDADVNTTRDSLHGATASTATSDAGTASARFGGNDASSQVELSLSALKPVGYDVRRATLSLILGAGLVFFGILFVMFSQVSSGWLTAQGTIVSYNASANGNSGTLYSPVVEYEVSGTTYTITGSTATSWVPTIGAEQDVLYNSNNPNSAKTKDGIGWTVLILLIPAVGVLFILRTVFSLVRNGLRSRQIAKLTRPENKMTGTLTAIRQLTVSNARGIYKLTVTATGHSGMAADYTSDKLTGPVGLSMVDCETNHIPIDVYVDSINPAQYYVDAASAPKPDSNRLRQLVSDSQNGLS